MHSSRIASVNEDVEHQVKASMEKLFRMAEADARFLWRKLGGGMEDNEAKNCSKKKKKTHARSSLLNIWARKELHEQPGGVRDCSSGGSHEDLVAGWIQKYLGISLQKEIAEKKDEQMIIVRVGRKIKKWFKKNMKPTATASVDVQTNFDFSLSWGCVSFHSEFCVKKPLWCKSLLKLV